MKKWPHLVISIFALVLFIPFTGASHLFDWDEINFAEAAREMIITGNYQSVQINFNPFWEKPPLFFWMQVVCMKLFGMNEFAARLPNALCGMLSLNVLFLYTKRWYNEKTAIWALLIYLGSFTPFFYFKSGIIDPWFNLFIFLAWAQIYQAIRIHSTKTKYYFLAGTFLGLSLLTKGPVAVIIFGASMGVFFLFNKFSLFFNVKQLFALVMSALLLPALWFLPDWIQNGFWFTAEFLNYQADLLLHPVASHGQPWFYHPLVLLIGCFPAALLAIPYLLGYRQSGQALLWMQILFWVVLLLFSMVTTKIVHYSSLCYLPVSILAAFGLSQHQWTLKKWQLVVFAMLGVLYSVIFLMLPMAGMGGVVQNFLIHEIHDDFVRSNLLVKTDWQWFNFIPGIVFLLSMVLFFLGRLRKSKQWDLRSFLLGNILFLFFSGILLVPKVENHVQGSIIKFYKSLKKQNIYIETVGFKSYAHYFYTQKPQPDERDSLSINTLKFCRSEGFNDDGNWTEEQRNAVNGFQKNWFLNGLNDKPVYLVFKSNRKEDMDTNKRFSKVLEEGGYSVYKKLN